MVWVSILRHLDEKPMCKNAPLGLFFPFQFGQVLPWVTTQQDNWVMSNFPHLELGPRVLGLQVVEDCSWLLFNRPFSSATRLPAASAEQNLMEPTLKALPFLG